MDHDLGTSSKIKHSETYQGKGIPTVLVSDDDPLLSRLALCGYSPSGEKDNIDPNEDTNLLHYWRCCHFIAMEKWVILTESDWRLLFKKSMFGKMILCY